MTSTKQRYAEWCRKPSVRFLRRVSFELCSVCNMRCRYCSLQKHEASYPHFMPLDVYEHAIQQLLFPPFRLEALGLYFSGESLLHPEFERLLIKTRDMVSRTGSHQPTVYMHTNGALWTPERTDSILQIGVLKRIIWSIDGVDSETGQHMRPGADYTRILSQLDYLLTRRRSDVEIWVNNMVDKTSMERPRDPKLVDLFRRVDKVRTIFPCDLNEGPRHGYYVTQPQQSFCCYILDTLVVTATGRLSLCCVDLNTRNAFGDLQTQSIEEAYLGEPHRTWLDWMAQNQRCRLPGCQKCTAGDDWDSFPFGTPVMSTPDLTTADR